MLLLPCGLLGGMAGAYRASIDTAGLSLLPAVRQADDAALIVAHFMPLPDQGWHGPCLLCVAGVQRYVARVLAMNLDSARSKPYPPGRRPNDA
jgi:hypothetical protein